MKTIDIIKLGCYIGLVLCFGVIFWGLNNQPEPTPPLTVKTFSGTIDCRNLDNVTFRNGYSDKIEEPEYDLLFVDNANNNRLTYITRSGCTVVVGDEND